MTEQESTTGRPRPATSGFDWGEPTYPVADTRSATETAEPAAEPDAAGAAGRHSVPEQRRPEKAASYGEYLADPPYAREAPPAPSDAGNPPRPSPVGRPPAEDDTEPARYYGEAAGSGAGYPLGTAVEPYGSGSDSYYGSVAPYRGSAAQPQALPAGADNEPHDTVTCPECGTVSHVHLHRRDATDFCPRCDYPLFWTPSQVARERDLGEHSEALRRLPGTVGRSTLASVPCPHCAELNLVSAQTCVRCGWDMHPVAPPPPVVYVPPPPPAPEPEPETGIAWWIWLLVGLGSAIVIALVVWYAIAHR